MSNLEKYEWSQIWFEDTSKPEKIVFIGDSITNNYFPAVMDQMRDEYCLVKYATSKAIDNPTLLKGIETILMQCGLDDVKLVQFNNGLHPGGLTVEEYKKFYDVLIFNIKQLVPSAKIVLATTTSVTNGTPDFINNDETNALVQEKNKAVYELAEKYGCAVDDLFPVTYNVEGIRADSVHYNANGNKLLADKVVECVRKVLAE